MGIVGRGRGTLGMSLPATTTLRHPMVLGRVDVVRLLLLLLRRAGGGGVGGGLGLARALCLLPTTSTSTTTTAPNTALVSSSPAHVLLLERLHLLPVQHVAIAAAAVLVAIAPRATATSRMGRMGLLGIVRVVRRWVPVARVWHGNRGAPAIIRDTSIVAAAAGRAFTSTPSAPSSSFLHPALPLTPRALAGLRAGAAARKSVREGVSA